jgi:hypothetical protein
MLWRQNAAGIIAMDLVFRIAVLCGVILLVWLMVQPRYAFVVRIVASNPCLAKGKVTGNFLQEIREVCTRFGVVHGVVRGIVRGRHISLHFSRSIPPPCQQQMRNMWALSGWSAVPKRA